MKSLEGESWLVILEGYQLPEAWTGLTKASPVYPYHLVCVRDDHSCRTRRFSYWATVKRAVAKTRTKGCNLKLYADVATRATRLPREQIELDLAHHTPRRLQPLELLPIKGRAAITERSGQVQTTLHRDKDQFAIVTTAETEDEFRNQWAEGLASEIRENPDEVAFVIERYTVVAAEIFCRYRGYKSNVVERKTIIAGHIDPHAEQAIIGRQAAETNGKGDTRKVPVPA